MKKKILTLFLAFAIAMTFMPSMAFADTQISELSVYCGVEVIGDEVICSYDTDNGDCSINVTFYFYRGAGCDTLEYYYSAGDWYNAKDEPMLEAPTDLDNIHHVVMDGSISPDEDYTFSNDYNVSLNMYINNYEAFEEKRQSDITYGRYGNMDSSYKGSFTENDYVDEDFTAGIVGDYLHFSAYYKLKNETSKLGDVIKGIAVVGAIAGVAALVGTVAHNVQKAAVAQKMAYKAKMQQKAVQKQAAAIKTALKGAAVVVSLAQFGSSLNKLFQVNQFGFNTFGFR